MVIKAKLTADEFKSLPDQLPKSEVFKVGQDGSVLAHVDPVDGFALENVTGLRSALESERAVASKYKPFEGLDAAAAREALTELPKLRDQLARSGPEAHRSQIEQLTKGFTEEKGKWGKREAGLISQLNKLLVDAEAMRVMSDPTVNGNPHLLLGPIRERTKVVEGSDGTFKSVVVDERGVERLTTNRERPPTEPMTVAELVLEMKNSKEYQGAFGGSGSSGTGSSGGGAGSSVNGTTTISAKEALDPIKYRAAKEAARKLGQTLQITE